MPGVPPLPAPPRIDISKYEVRGTGWSVPSESSSPDITRTASNSAAATESEASVAQGQSTAGVDSFARSTPAEVAGSIPAEASPHESEEAPVDNKRMESLPPAREHVLDNGNLLIDGIEMPRSRRVMPAGWRSEVSENETPDPESLPPIQRD